MQLLKTIKKHNCIKKTLNYNQITDISSNLLINRIYILKKNLPDDVYLFFNNQLNESKLQTKLYYKKKRIFKYYYLQKKINDKRFIFKMNINNPKLFKYYKQILFKKIKMNLKKNKTISGRLLFLTSNKVFIGFSGFVLSMRKKYLHENRKLLYTHRYPSMFSYFLLRVLKFNILKINLKKLKIKFSRKQYVQDLKKFIK